MHLLRTTSISAKNTAKGNGVVIILHKGWQEKKEMKRVGSKGKYTPDGDAFTEVFFLCSMCQC